MSLLFRWAQRCCFVSFCAGSGGGGIYVCLVTCLTSAKYKHACTRTHVCMHAHTRTHMHACTHTDTHAHAHMHARTHITLICTHARTHAHTHARTHTHTHTSQALTCISSLHHHPYTPAKTVFIAIHGKFMKKWLYICWVFFSLLPEVSDMQLVRHCLHCTPSSVHNIHGALSM